MRIAFISAMHGLPWGGSEELWSQAAVQLKLAGHEVRASVMYWPQLSEKLDALTSCGIELETYRPPSYLVGPGRDVWNRVSRSYRGSFARLKRFQPDLVVISQGHNAGGFDWAKICRDAAIPYVIIVQCNGEQWWFDDRALSQAVASYTGAQKVFCVSRRNLDLLRLQLGEPVLNGEVIWNPYNVSSEPAPAWPAENGKWRLACVGRIDVAAKGQDVLLQTLALQEWRSRPIEVNLFGSGPHELGLQRDAAMLNLNQVHFRGYVNDIRAIWQQNHILVMPSRYEGLPLALVEAMWCARPAIVTDVGGNAELCIDDETGFVAAAPTVSSFSGALQRAWDRREDWLHLGRAARARVENLIPRDAVAVFCEKLKVCATAESLLAQSKSVLS
jgi:glycosyltransferase involved in cell wall biosynthesis